TGNVGIGTTEPAAKLDVRGSIFALGEGTGFLTDAQTSARVGLIKYGGREGGIWRTSAQDFEIGRVDSGVTALPGSPTTWTTDLYISGTGSVGVGTASPTGLFSVGSSNHWYVSTTNLNTLNTAGSTNGVADGWINYRGYADGFTQVRNFNIGDGKGNNIAWFDGTNRYVSINNGQAASYNLHVNGTAYVSGAMTVVGYLTKSGGGFSIDHPLDPANKLLTHSFVESPDMKNLYDGVAVLNENGEITIELPEWFEALNKDFRYQLTPIGKAAMLYVKEEVKDNKFVIAGEPGIKVSWQVTGTRKDAWAEKNRPKVEEEKGSRDGLVKKGEYIAKDIYGKLETDSPKTN
ncbi:MAG: hypothetical protein HY350_01565, partial [Candidatus Omnitrophica bacterium]|nr:hypothetical protein [Candidatus Omnitrophota bacterium]